MWPTLITLSVLAGGICGGLIRGRRAILWGCAVPWLGMLAWLLYNEYLLLHGEGGASMWPVAQLFAGTVMAIAGGLAAAAVRVVTQRGAAA